MNQQLPEECPVYYIFEKIHILKHYLLLRTQIFSYPHFRCQWRRRMFLKDGVQMLHNVNLKNSFQIEDIFQGHFSHTFLLEKVCLNFLQPKVVVAAKFQLKPARKPKNRVIEETKTQGAKMRNVIFLQQFEWLLEITIRSETGRRTLGLKQDKTRQFKYF